MESPTNRFYRTVWRWHFYAGLFVIPFMLILAATGMIYLFKPQLDVLMYHNQMLVQQVGTMLPYTQQLEVAQSAYPNASGVYTLSAFPDDPTQEMTMHIDQYSGKVLAEVRWQDYGLVPKAVEMGIAIHMGKYFGLGNQLLMLFACLVVIILCVSGVAMWWWRRPAGRIGAPMLPVHVPQWKIPLVIVAVLGIVFPLVGFSLVTVLLLDYLVISRTPILKGIFN